VRSHISGGYIRSTAGDAVIAKLAGLYFFMHFFWTDLQDSAQTNRRPQAIRFKTAQLTDWNRRQG
jgi:hypothetical protein